MLRDFYHAIRLLGRNPAFALISIAAIALGIGANTALFSIVKTVVLEPLPFAEPERLVMVWETRPDRGRLSNVVSNANYLDWKARNQVFDAMSPVFYFTNSLLSGGEPEEIRIQMVGEDFFPMLGVKMQLGRAFRVRSASRARRWWRSSPTCCGGPGFPGDRNIVGRTIRLGSDATTVIGVTPPDLLTISDRQPMLWRNARVSGVNSNGGRAAGRNMAAVLARLKRGLNAESADRHMVGLAKQLEQEFPQFNAKWSARVSPLSEELTGKVRTPLFFMLGAVACVL